ncbi:MAG TPA: ornithine cyclodeaminase family protein [Steroidobacteraceae bacterium]|jgi:ornithine cyclodeaminase|nr:ornithine cyclodeaminase family protein [Steroidobacteraceae bacterium]
MEIRLLRGAEVRQLLPMTECIDLMQQTMIAVSEGRVVLPLRSILVMPGDRGMLGMMPGYLAEPECFGVKLVSLIPRNKPPQYSSHLGLVLLFEAEHGRPVALLDAAEITAIRTAAASGLATRLLAQPEAGDLALLGAGEQACSHLEAMLCVRPLRRIRLWARDRDKARNFAKTEGARRRVSIETSATVAEAVAGADIICTTTKAREPILQGDWLTPGVHLNVVGSSIAAAAEIDTPAVVKSRFFVDCRNSTVNEGGEYLRALRAGAITPEHILGEIGEVANGTKEGRRSPLDMTLYKSLGIAPQDLAAAHHVLAKARAAGIGQMIDF